MDPIKWYSAALKAAEALPQNFGTSDQMAAMLSKYGAKASELNYLGVPKFMSQFDKRVPKQALVDFIDEHKVLPTEVVKSGRSAIRDDPVIQAGAIADNPQLFEDLTSLRHNALTPGQRMNAVNAVPDFEFENFIANHPEQFGGSSSKYSDYATHPDSGYKETLLTLPHAGPTKEQLDKTAQNSYGYDNYADLAPYRRAAINARLSKPPLYQSSHWDEPNVLLHLRTSSPGTYDMLLPSKEDGTKASSVPFLEELQSDWGQTGRKIGFKNDNASEIKFENGVYQPYVNRIPIHNIASADPENASNMLAGYLKTFNRSAINPAPLVTNTNDWASAGVRRFLAEAAQQDAPQVAWTTGQQQSARYSGHAPEGMSGFYDKMLPSIMSKYLKPYGGQVTLAPATAFDVTRDGQPVNHFLTREEADNYLNGISDRLLEDHDWRSVPVQPGPHTATLPQSFRDQIMKNGIPFFKHGGTVDYYANQPVEG